MQAASSLIQRYNDKGRFTLKLGDAPRVLVFRLLGDRTIAVAESESGAGALEVFDDGASDLVPAALAIGSEQAARQRVDGGL